MDIQLDVVGVRVEMPSQQPVVLLREATGSRYVPSWVGSAEASSIAFAASGVVPPRPLTHDLMADVLTALGVTLERVRITDLRDGVFYAELDLVGPSGPAQISARPSDAIALAMRLSAPITGTEAVVADAGIEISQEQLSQTDDSDSESLRGADPEQAVAEFRQFLEQINPEDFNKPST